MSSRPSLKKAQSALKELTRAPVSGDDFSAILRELIRIRNDRGAAVVAASLVEMALESRLLLNFRPLSPDEYHLLFRGEQAPLGTLAAKTKVAYAMRLCSAQERDDLDCIRRIRNAFAHTLKRLSFETKEIADLCSHLKLGEKGIPSTTRPNWGSRSQYIAAATSLAVKFSGTEEERNRLHLAQALEARPSSRRKGLLSERPPSHDK